MVARGQGHVLTCDTAAAREAVLREGLDGVSGAVERLADSGDFPHLLLHGPSGGGKEILLHRLLQRAFGLESESALKLRVETKAQKLTLPSGSKVEVDLTTVSSAYHVEVNPSDVGIRDALVVKEIMKEWAQIGASRPGANPDGLSHVIVLHEVEKLTRNAQQALRATMEKNQRGCRLVLMTSARSKVIDPIVSRCLSIRVPAPTAEAVERAVAEVCPDHGLPAPVLRKVATQHRSFRAAFMLADVHQARKGVVDAGGDLEQVQGWRRNIQEAARKMVRDQSPKALYEVRQQVYAALVHCISPQVVFVELVDQLFCSLDDQLKYTVATWAAHYEARLSASDKAVFHIEAFVAKFMALYKEWTLQLLG
jgi:replication factor C subunit 3/5